ncbi:MAG: hypothetical protein QOF70_1000, partial [Acetobacteraceae bacterium]|nr:hypothetical protein [Acetobacteraceae bacterium]
RQMGNVDPALALNVGGYLLLCRNVRGINPGGAQFLDPRAVGPAEPGGFSSGTQEMQGRGLHVQPIGSGAQHAPTARAADDDGDTQ